jgi:hypothetical protein
VALSPVRDEGGGLLSMVRALDRASSETQRLAVSALVDT